MSKNSFKLFLAAIAIGIVPALIKSERKPILDVDPISARALLNNDFESGFEEPWYDSSPSTVHWIVEDFSLQSELNNPVPAPSAGSKYLRAIRNEQLSSGLLILRTVTFTALPGDEISFNFWIRSRYTGGNTLDVIHLTSAENYSSSKLYNIREFVVAARVGPRRIRNDSAVIVELFHFSEFRMASNFESHSGNGADGSDGMYGIILQ
jgi:hypothetical protein